MVKQQPLGIEVVFRCPHRLQSALLPVWPVPAPKGRLSFLRCADVFFVNFIMSVLDVGKSFRHVFSCKFKQHVGYGVASVCVLEILNQKSLRMTAFAFGVRLATIFVLSSLDR